MVVAVVVVVVVVVVRVADIVVMVLVVRVLVIGGSSNARLPGAGAGPREPPRSGSDPELSGGRALLLRRV